MTALPWWLEIQTQTPQCTYYFGPFASKREAEDSRFGYLQDLYMEQATGFSVTVSQKQPEDLTLCNE